MLAVTYHKMFTIIFVGFFMSYFIGSFYYMIAHLFETEADVEAQNTFRTYFFSDENEYDTGLFRCITMTYFMLTTLTSIGYGDLYGKSVLEQCISMVVFFIGLTFTAYVVTTFLIVLEDLESVA
jgi:ABC-type glycerol-3-phosphate transport system permease component